MENLWITLFGVGKDLTTLQVCVRALFMFFVALILLRVGGIRIFGKKSSFDEIVMIMLGAILSRGVMGASPFGTTVAAGAVIIVVHRLVAWVCLKNEKLASVIKGKSVVLYKDGKLFEKHLHRCLLSESDLMESLRTDAGKTSLSDVEIARMEPSGKISFIFRRSFLE